MKIANEKSKVILIVCNAVLIIITVIVATLYSVQICTEQEENRKAEFLMTVDLMKKVSQNYMDNERGYVHNWANYINQNAMNMEDALEFLREINTNANRYAHIVDMDTFEAYSAYYPRGKEKISTYEHYLQDDTEYSDGLKKTMQDMYDGVSADFCILGKYRIEENMGYVVGIGDRITLTDADGKKDYLILRIIPIDELKKYWVFPVEYTSAEVGIITNTGDYVIQSDTMKSSSFPEYIRGYNFQDDYNKVYEVKQQLRENASGTFVYNNFRGDECLWYYSSFGENSSLDILGVVNVQEIDSTIDSWFIVILISGALLILFVMDSMYLFRINRTLRKTALLAEQASVAKTQFLSAMSHDIRTPMNAIIGMMTIAQKNIYDSKQVSSCIDKSLHAGKQLLTLINDVLDISKIESGKFTLNKNNFCIDDLIGDLMDMMAPNITEKNIEFESNFENLPHKYLYADILRINQIYVNLFSNAVKYTECGGKISLRIYEEALQQRENATRLVFCISDTGIGLSEEFQKTMYHSFARAVNTQVNKIQGSGLGLSIVKQLVDLMEGTIECDSKLGEGTTFVVKLDLEIVEQAQIDKMENEENEVDIASLKLLVAEDNEINWEIVKVLLSEYGVTCERVENGKECVERIKSVPNGTYQAILMDVQMPIMNGLEAARQIRALPDEKVNAIPIIAMTADAFAEDVQACLEAGMNGHISKPIDLNKVLYFLRKIKNEDYS